MSEELKEEDLLKQFKEVNIKDILLLLADIVSATGKYMIDVGEAASKRENVFKLPSLTSSSVGKLLGEKFMEEIPEDKLGPILKTIYKIGARPDFSELLKESPDDIIKKGKEFVDLGTKLKELMESE